MAQRENIIRLYGQYSVRLAELVRDAEKLSMDEQIFIENHLLIVQLAITGKKYGAPKKSTAVKV